MHNINIEMLHLNTIPWHTIVLHMILLLSNILLYIYASKIIAYFNNNKTDNFQLTILRSVNVIFVFFQLIDFIISLITDDYSNYFRNFAATLFVVYIAAFIYTISSFFTRKKFGKEKTLDTKSSYIDTYNSRLIDIFLLILISFVAIYLVVNIWGLKSLLETTGFLGLIIAFLALTNQIWAPDPYYCMVILSSEMIEDGDVIRFDGEQKEYIVSRVTFIYTLLYDIQNNHRTMMRNSKLIDKKIENLSKKVSTEGLRQTLVYKIGYPKMDGSFDIKTHQPFQYTQFMNRINSMFTKVHNEASENSDVKIDDKIAFEWILSNTGDYALEFTLIYYLDALPNTKLTKIIRSHIYKTRAIINRSVYEASLCAELSLATPDLLEYTKVN